MKRYTLSAAAAMEHKPEHPERTACRGSNLRDASGWPVFDITFQVWPSRAAMLKTIEMQGRRESRGDDWKACALPVAEGVMV